MSYRKQVKHYHEPGQLHELTFSSHQRRQLLTNDDWRERLARRIDAAGDAEQCDLVAFVFMPEHVHLLIYPRDEHVSIGRYLALIKQPFSSEIKDILIRSQPLLVEQLTVLERPGKTCFRFWQEGPGYDRNMYSLQAILASIEYIHNNPVRRGLCSTAAEWICSSARYYSHAPQGQQFLGLPHVHGIPGGRLS